VNIGAGPRLEMTVVQGSWLRALLNWVSAWFSGGMPWTGGALALLLVAAGVIVWLMRRRAKRSGRAPQLESVAAVEVSPADA
jgi:hypothetical protein